MTAQPSRPARQLVRGDHIDFGGEPATVLSAVPHFYSVDSHQNRVDVVLQFSFGRRLVELAPDHPTYLN